MINFRKWLCSLTHKGTWLYSICDCQRYDPPIPPDPPDPDLPPKYIGVSAYQLIKYPIEDIDVFLKNLAAAVKGGKGNGYSPRPITEVFFVATWDELWRWQPYDLVRKQADYDENGNPLYNGYEFPVYDLDSFDDTVWFRWGRIFDMCREYGITLSIRIMDQCSVKDGFEKRHNAMRSNIQRFDTEELKGGLYGEPIRKWYKALADKLVRELEYHKVDYFINPWNEFDVILDGWTEEQGNAVAMENMKWWTDMLLAIGVDPSRILISTGREWEKMSKMGFIMEEHGTASPEKMNLEVSAAWEGGYKVFPNGDGPDPKAQGAANFKGYREPSVEQAQEMRPLLAPGHVMGYAYLDRSVEEVQGKTDLKKAKFDVVKTLAGKE